MNLHLTFISALAFLLVACTAQSDYNKMLVQADSLMTSRPDSALHILQGIAPQQLSAQADKPYYALLLTQARDKNFIVQTDDSLIRTAVQYYDSIKDIRMQAKAHYLLGSVYRDADRCAPAIQSYLMAATFARTVADNMLLGRIYNNAGYLYLTQGLNEKADSIFQLTEGIAIQLKDSSLWAEVLSQQGKIDIRKGTKFYPEAERKLQQALLIAERAKKKTVEANISASLSYLYSRMKKAKEAIQYAKQSITLQEDTTDCYWNFLLLGEAYFKAKQYDSATIYLYKSIPSQVLNTKAGAYMRLADIAKIQGNTAQALDMERLYSTYTDSIRRQQQGNDIINVEKEIQIELQQEEYESFLEQYHYYLIVIFIAALLIIYLLRRRYHQKNEQLKIERVQLEEKEKNLHQLYTEAKDELILKDKEIEELQKEVNIYQINEENRQKLQLELNALNQKREALAKEKLEHSDVYAKMERIILDYKQQDASNEKLEEKDWQQFLVETDMRWNGKILQLRAQYDLSKEQIHLICLFLTDFPFANLEYLIHFSRKTLYRKKDEIFKTLGIASGSDIKDFLRNYET